MTDQGVLSEFTGSEYIFKILQEVDGGRRGERGYLKNVQHKWVECKCIGRGAHEISAIAKAGKVLCCQQASCRNGDNHVLS